MTGIRLQEKDKQMCTNALQNFLQTALQIPVKLDGYFTIGTSEIKPIVLIFPSLQQKYAVFQNKAALKNVRVEGRKIYINEYLPPVALEKKKRDQDIVSKFKSAGQEDKLSYSQGTLNIQGVPYQKRVVPPSPKDLVNISAEQVEQILKIQTQRGEEFSKENSKFIAYTAQVSTHLQINQVYKKIKMIRPNARHIVCAYIIDHKEEIYAEDFHDDGEPGAGRVILEMMKNQNIRGRAIFVARKYGGKRMGLDRFAFYLKAAKSCVGVSDDETVNQTIPKKTTSHQFRGRGRGAGQNPRGRGRGHAAINTQQYHIQFNKTDTPHPQATPWQPNPSLNNLPSMMQSIANMQQQLQIQLQATPNPSRYEKVMGPQSAAVAKHNHGQNNNPHTPTFHRRKISPEADEHVRKKSRGGNTPSPQSSRRSSVCSQDMESDERHEDEDTNFVFSNPDSNREQIEPEDWANSKDGQWSSQ